MGGAGNALVFLVAFAFIAHVDTVVVEERTIPTGSEWLYSYREDVVEPGVLMLSANGTMRQSCLGLGTLNASGEGPELLLYESTTMANLDGTVAVFDPSQGMIWIEVSGELTISELDYYDPYTMEPRYLLLNQEMRVVQWGSTSPLLYYEEHNFTCYSDVITLPASIGFDVEAADLSSPTNWTVVYSGNVSINGYEDYEEFSRSISLLAHVNKTYVGNETVDVPAGRYECMRILSDYLDADVTEWYSSVVGAPVKISTALEGDLTVCSLTEYELKQETLSANGDDFVMRILFAGVAVAVAALAVTIAFYIRRRRKPPVDQITSIPEEEQRVG